MSSTAQSQPGGVQPASSQHPSPPPPPPHQNKHDKQHQQPPSLSRSSYFTFPVTHVVSGLYRRLTEPALDSPPNAPARTATEPMNASDIIFTPRRRASPFQPPPLTPLSLKVSSAPSTQLLTRALAEEIRLLVPPRLQLVDTWALAYSLDRDGSSLSTLYEKSREFAARSQRAGYVLVVRSVSSSHNASAGDTNGGGTAGGSSSLFGAYLTDPPHPAPHYYGTGECFLWRASTLASTPLLSLGGNEQRRNQSGKSEEAKMLEVPGLPLPPSADTTHLRGRSTTFRGEEWLKSRPSARTDVGKSEIAALTSSLGNDPGSEQLQDLRTVTNTGNAYLGDSTKSGTSTPDRIRFKAFPYSGINDYMILCETGFLSVGGGDGHYGLWLDDSFEKGISSPCLTFGNEPLCDEGTKFDVMNVELWYIGN
ncbi:oxidation resistance protein 1 [Ophidiomyces ophidiicola]|uniref:oxidation resistance protein 1 n=1 Tax=Ophidiomyces ophidiicola TaxID=1387563 RepID=UPI0020C3E96E|nr:oxidation resistance protein 1 [Ophidiomyces ophidiicola]KAI1945217.1 oxidation resistance protein 1 [Ophidiomyces ophidiicola]KAI2052494.1 oxidation resistance protein 1 [Ophidiomyces ophidiicola]